MTKPEKAEAWTLNILKTFKAMEALDNHLMRLASCIFKEEPHSGWREAEDQLCWKKI